MKENLFYQSIKIPRTEFFLHFIDVYKVYECNDYDKIYKALSTLKNKKLKVNNILVEKYKNILENPDFEQEFYSRTAIGIYKNGNDSIRLIDWLAFYDRFYYETIY